MFDLPQSEALNVAIRSLFEAGKTVAAVCHGPAGLVGATLSDGTPLVNGKTIATFTDEEERATGLDIYMPFMLETRLRELSANIALADNFTENVQVDGNLVTGQNPQSTVAVIKTLKQSTKNEIWRSNSSRYLLTRVTSPLMRVENYI